MSHRVYLSLGSNIDRERHIKAALVALTKSFGELNISPVYESEAVGFDGDPFYNLVVGFDTTQPLAAVISTLKSIEDRNGRVRGGAKFSGRTLDIDVLTYGDLTGVHDGILLPRDEIDQNAYVLLPLADIAGDEMMPGTDKTYAELWAGFDKGKQRLWVVALGG